MTKKHFILFAAAIKSKFHLDQPWAEVHVNTQSAALSVIDVVCEVAHESNDRFDETRFRRACGVPA